MKYIAEKRKIILDRELNALDKFVLDFCRLLKDYVIISGYVSIILGRSRATEDVDLFIKKIPKEKFIEMYNNLIRHNFWCLNSDDADEIFDYIDKGLAVRFARGKMPVPNIEVKFPKDKLDEDAFEDIITVKLPEGEMKISSLERNIAFKRYFLGADKDKEDALHIEELFMGKINLEKIKKIKELIKRRQDEIRNRKKSFYEARKE